MRRPKGRGGVCPSCGRATLSTERGTEVGDVLECQSCGWNNFDELLEARLRGQTRAYESWTEG